MKMSDRESRIFRTSPDRIDRWDSHRPVGFDNYNVSNIQHKPGCRVLAGTKIKIVLRHDELSSRPIIHLYMRHTGFDSLTLNDYKDDPSVILVMDFVRAAKKIMRNSRKRELDVHMHDDDNDNDIN